MCFHAARINNELDCSIWLKSNELDAREYVASELFSEWLVPTASMLYRKEVNDISIANEDDVLNGDLILVLKCCRYGKVMALRDEMSVYRMHSGGITYSEQFAKERALKYPAHLKCQQLHSATLSLPRCRQLYALI